MNKQAFIVVGMGYGDEGKGTIVEALCRQHDAGLVVRFNGGSQCGHNVVLPDGDGTHHTFSQFGCGTFRNIPTLLGRKVIVDPLTIQTEAKVLETKGIRNPLANLLVDERALVTTPFHTSLNRLREMSRLKRHGSCGKGVGETVAHSLAHPDEALHVSDLNLDTQVLVKKLIAIRERLRFGSECVTGVGSNSPAFQAFLLEMSTFDDPQIVDLIVDRYRQFTKSVKIVNPEQVNYLLNLDQTLVFEGAQGILLDEWYGFHPYTTWSTTTSEYAHDMLRDAEYDGKTTTVGVTRTFMTRHGPGPFPTETDELALAIKGDHNVFNEWQREFRAGWLDLTALKYAQWVDGTIDTLAVTHCDRDITPYRVGANYDSVLINPSKFINKFCYRRKQETLALVEKEITNNLLKVDSISTTLDAAGLISWELNLPVLVKSYGPTYLSKEWTA